MNLLRRLLRRPTAEVLPPTRCGCLEHVDVLADLFITARGGQPWTVRELLDAEAIAARPTHGDERWLNLPGDRAIELDWVLWFGDETRDLYDDEAAPLDVVLATKSGVRHVEWEDREVMRVGAPNLCRDGVLAAMALTLADPSVRLP